MKKVFSYFIILVALVMLLAACSGNSNSHQYLMTHPKYLKNQAQQCMRSDSVGQQPSKTCQVVIQAAQDFDDLVLAISANPFAFGQKILHTQQKLAKAKQRLQSLQKQRPNDSSAINSAKQAVVNLQQQIARMLAVVRVTSA